MEVRGIGGRVATARHYTNKNYMIWSPIYYYYYYYCCCCCCCCCCRRRRHLICHYGERLCGPRSLISTGYRGIFLRVRRTRYDAKSSLPSSVELKAWLYISLHSKAFPLLTSFWKLLCANCNYVAVCTSSNFPWCFPASPANSGIDYFK